MDKSYKTTRLAEVRAAILEVQEIDRVTKNDLAQLKSGLFMIQISEKQIAEHDRLVDRLKLIRGTLSIMLAEEKRVLALGSDKNAREVLPADTKDAKSSGLVVDKPPVILNVNKPNVILVGLRKAIGRLETKLRAINEELAQLIAGVSSRTLSPEKKAVRNRLLTEQSKIREELAFYLDAEKNLIAKEKQLLEDIEDAKPSEGFDIQRAFRATLANCVKEILTQHTTAYKEWFSSQGSLRAMGELRGHLPFYLSTFGLVTSGSEEEKNKRAYKVVFYGGLTLADLEKAQKTAQNHVHAFNTLVLQVNGRGFYSRSFFKNRARKEKAVARHFSRVIFSIYYLDISG